MPFLRETLSKLFSKPFNDQHSKTWQSKTNFKFVSPQKHSYNDAINKRKILKISLSSVTKVSQALKSAGYNAKFSKQDIVDAYKLIPCAKNVRQFFYFKWLGKFFADVSTPFGSKTAPANFDCLWETLANIAKTNCKLPESCVLRQLDDLPVVAPAQSNWAEIFTAEFRDICKETGIPLAHFLP
jgi:hypothetical protein